MTMNDRTVARPWWREPMMWLVIGGPAVVVVAAVTTAAIALHRPDPLIRADAAKPPAVQARNHAATPRPQVPAAQP
jgi:hypothetical protein